VFAGALGLAPEQQALSMAALSLHCSQRSAVHPAWADGGAHLLYSQRGSPTLQHDDAMEVGLDAMALSLPAFLMYEFKVRRCPKLRAHDWMDCPYAHAGEKARRRDPRMYHYAPTVRLLAASVPAAIGC
jgi:hypothetical protein